MQVRALFGCAAIASLLFALLPSAYAQPAPAPDTPAPAPENTAGPICEKARTTFSAGDIAAACVLFEQCHQAASTAPAGSSGPSPEQALLEWGACYEKLGKADLALSKYDQAAAGSGPKAEEAKARALALRGPPPAANPPPTTTTAPPPTGKEPPPVAVIGPGAQAPAAGDVKTPAAEPAKKEEPHVRIGDFMDTRLTWAFGDDDIVHQTGQATPLSPNASIGDRRQYRLFFDNLNSRFAGRENLTHLVLYKKMPGFINHLDTEASVVVRLDIAALTRNTNNLNQSLYDSGSFIRAFYHTDGNDSGKTGLGITLFPLDTDRFRLGYLYDISWGGTAASINQSIFPRIQGGSPGAKIQFDSEKFSIFAGFKTATIVQVQQTLTPGTSEVEEIRIGQTNYGLLAGGSADITDELHFDLGGGYFQQGRFDLPDVAGVPVYTYGGSIRAAYHHKDMPVGQSIDFALYRNDPNKPQIIFKPETYTPGKTTYAVSAEFSNLLQVLKDFDRAGATAIQSARAFAMQANLKSGYLRASLTGIYRDLPFVLRNQPSFIPFQTLPKDAFTDNEFFMAAAADYYIESLRLTPGIGGGLQLPATFRTKSIDAASSPIERTVVVREQGNIAILPVNQEAVPIFQARASLKWDISKILSAIAWLQYVRDNNLTFVERDPNEGTIALRTFIDPNFFGFGASVSARF